MRVTLKQLNAMPFAESNDLWRACCGSRVWCKTMTQMSPHTSVEQIHHSANQAFQTLAESDWREAFEAHPPLGNLNSLRMKYAGNATWSGGEQAGTRQADEQTIQQLADWNERYREKFGHIFILCATGKTAFEMLSALQSRFLNSAADELQIAAQEQSKITHLRIDKLITEAKPEI